MADQCKEKRRRQVIEHLHSKEVASTLLELFTNDDRFHEGSFEEKSSYFKKNYSSIIFDFCRYLQHLKYFDEEEKKCQEFLEDKTLIPIIFTFDQFLVIRQEDKLEYLLKYGTMEMPQEKAKYVPVAKDPRKMAKIAKMKRLLL